MTIVSLSYVRTTGFHDPQSWLNRIRPYALVLEALAKKHSVISIQQIEFEGRHSSNGVEYYFMHEKNVRFPKSIHRLVKELKPDAVIVHGLNHPLQVIQLRRAIGKGVRLMVQSHAEKIPTGWRKSLQKIADRNINAYLFTSFDMANDWLSKQLIVGKQKIKEVMIGASTFTAGDKLAARSITKAGGEPVFLFVGRVDNNKDPFTLIKAFGLFAESHPGASLYIIFQNEEKREELQAIINTHANNKSVHLIGNVPHKDMQSWYNSAHFIVSTSHAEAFGMAVAEAMSCNCIPIVSNIPSLRKLTGNGACGILFEPGNVHQLAAAFENASTLDKETQRKKVHAFYNLHLSADAIAKQIEDAARSN